MGLILQTGLVCSSIKELMYDIKEFTDEFLFLGFIQCWIAHICPIYIALFLASYPMARDRPIMLILPIMLSCSAQKVTYFAQNVTYFAQNYAQE